MAAVLLPAEVPAANKQKEVPRPQDAIDTLPPYFGLKRLVAVTQFINKSGYQGQLQLGNGLADMLTDALMRSGRFIVAERQQLKDVLREQDLAQSGRAIAAGAAEVGKLLNAQAIVIGTVTHYDEHLMVGAGAVGGGPQFRVSTATARLQINVRVVDTTTGEVILSQSSRATDQASALATAFGGSGFARTASGKVCQRAITDAVHNICRTMDEVPWRGRIVDVRGDDIIINAGQRLGVVPGDCFRVFTEHDVLLDPENGLPLGSPLSAAGVVQVREVQLKFAVARPLTGANFARGQVIRFVPAFEIPSSSPALSSSSPLPPDAPGIAAIRAKHAKGGGTTGLAELNKYLGDHPDDVNGLLLRTAIILKSTTANKHVALQDTRRLQQLRPNDPDLPVLEARAALALNDRKAALAALDRALQMTPGNLDAVLLHRRVAEMIGDADLAFRDSRRACNLGYKLRPKLRKPLENFSAKDPFASLPPVYGPKMRIALSAFGVNQKNAAALLGTGLPDAIADRLAGTGRFIMVERQQIADVLREQDFAKSGRTVEQAAPQIGRLLNAQALLFGAVTRFEMHITRGQQASEFGGAQFEVAYATLRLGAAVRLVDTTTGQVICSKESLQQKTKPALGGAYADDNIQMSSAGMARLPVEEVSRMVVDDIALHLARTLQNRAWLGRIVAVRGDDVFINAGAEQAVAPGDCFLVLTEDELRDPATGLLLGAARKSAGAIEVRHVEAKFAIARAVRGGGLTRGQALKFVPAHVVKGPAATAATVPPPADTPEVAQARALFARKGFYDADRAVDAILAAKPDDASARWFRAEINLRSSSGNKHQAVRDARLLQQMQAADPALPVLEARAAEAAHDAEAALAALDRALKLDPQNVDALLWHKELAGSLGDAEAVARDARRLFNLGVDSTKAKRRALKTPTAKR
ncbi:MAG: CsgG/HfaB family protein [Verrucomicrobiia bacterium]